MRFKVRNTVDFPASDGPMKAVTLRDGTDNSASATRVEGAVIDVDALQISRLYSNSSFGGFAISGGSALPASTAAIT